MADEKDVFRQDHEKMRRTSELPVTGPAATDTVAASSGLELPGRVGEGNTADQQADRADADRVPPETAVSVEKIERVQRGEE